MNRENDRHAKTEAGDPFVSFLIPVFNTPSKLLESCLKSVAYWPDSAIEIIIVDDGSDSETAKQCDSFCEIEPRARVVHKTNNGVSSARNTALNIAGGEWVVFVDSDDCISTSFVPTFFALQIPLDVNVVFGRVRHRFADKLEETECWFGEGEYRVYTDKLAKDQAISRVMTSVDLVEQSIPNQIQIGPCAKAFRSSAIQKIRFKEELFISEDRFFTCEALLEHGGFICCDDVWYIVNHHAQSTTQSFDVYSWTEGLSLAYKASLNQPFAEQCRIGCIIQAMKGVETLVERFGIKKGYQALRILEKDKEIGLKARFDYTPYAITSRRKLIIKLYQSGWKFGLLATIAFGRVLINAKKDFKRVN